MMLLLFSGLVLVVGCGQSSQPREQRDAGGPARRPEKAQPAPDAEPAPPPVRELPPATGCGRGDLTENEYIKVSRYLRRQFRPDSTEAPPEKRSLGVRFIAERVCFKELPMPELAKHQSTMRFFLTELDSNYTDFPRVKALLVLTFLHGVYDVTEVFSPTFSEPEPFFFSKFVGLDVPGAPAQERVAAEIVSFFEMVTPAASIKNVRFSDATYRVELWSGDRHVNDLLINYNERGMMHEMTLTEASSTKIVTSVTTN